MRVKKQMKKVLYNVQCVYDEKHVFEKVFEIEAGTEEKEETEVETYCPYCNKLVTVVVIYLRALAIELENNLISFNHKQELRLWNQRKISVNYSKIGLH